MRHAPEKIRGNHDEIKLLSHLKFDEDGLHFTELSEQKNTQHLNDSAMFLQR